MKDKTGRPLTKQQTPRPKWTPPYTDAIYIAGFKLLSYAGYFHKNETSKGQHWYNVACMGCKSEYIRVQGSLTRAIEKGTRGCHKCAKARQKEDKEAAKERQEKDQEERFKEWLWINFLIPVTSLRVRHEMRRCFDTEKAKVLGWRTI